MNYIDVFYQAEGLGDVGHVKAEPDMRFEELKELLAEKVGLPVETILLFVEDKVGAVDDDALLKDYAEGKVLKIHLHRLREVEVRVAFNGVSAEARFSPSATVSQVKGWAAQCKFGMTKEEAGEHVLQIVGTHVRPRSGTHIGSLTDEKTCALAFDLVPHERVNGFSGRL